MWFVWDFFFFFFFFFNTCCFFWRDTSYLWHPQPSAAVGDSGGDPPSSKLQDFLPESKRKKNPKPLEQWPCWTCQEQTIEKKSWWRAVERWRVLIVAKFLSGKTADVPTRVLLTPRVVMSVWTNAENSSWVYDFRHWSHFNKSKPRK